MTAKLTAWGEELNLNIAVESYANDNLAIELYDKEGPYALLTVNLGIALPPDEAFVDTNNCSWAYEFIKTTGIGEYAGRIERSNWCTYPLYKFDLAKIAEYKN